MYGSSCVGKHCITYEVTCIACIFRISLVECWPLKGTYLPIGKSISCLIILFALPALDLLDGNVHSCLISMISKFPL